MSEIRSTTRSIASAMRACAAMWPSSASTSTTKGSWPYPSSSASSSRSGIRDSTVGFAILYPLRCRIGNTVPSEIGSRNLFACHDAANGPVSASPSPITQATSRSGLSSAAP
jgi:hypothetical protein